MGKEYERLAGIEGAKKEGYTHTNQARVRMASEEEISKPFDDTGKGHRRLQEKGVKEKLKPAPEKDVDHMRRLRKEHKRPQKDPTKKEIEILDV